MPMYLVLVMSAVISVSYWLEEHSRWVTHISGVLLIIIIASILSNAGIIPSSEASYRYTTDWMMPIGIILMLFSFNPRDVVNLDKKMLWCFFVGAIGTAIGGLVAGYLLRGYLPNNAWQVSGQLTASFVGGYENAVSVGVILGTPSPIFLKAFAGDSIFTAIWILVNIYQGRRIQGDALVSDDDGLGESREVFFQGFDVVSLAFSLTMALLVFKLSLMLHASFPFFPKLLWAGLLATCTTFLPIKHRLVGTYTMGSFLLSYFIFSCGAISDVGKLFGDMSVVLAFPLLIVLIHAIILFGYAHYMRVDKEIAILASQCLIGGPATALAVVTACRWRLAMPAVVMGLMGYAVGNYFGLLVAWLLK